MTPRPSWLRVTLLDMSVGSAQPMQDGEAIVGELWRLGCPCGGKVEVLR